MNLFWTDLDTRGARDCVKLRGKEWPAQGLYLLMVIGFDAEARRYTKRSNKVKAGSIPATRCSL